MKWGLLECDMLFIPMYVCIPRSTCTLWCYAFRRWSRTPRYETSACCLRYAHWWRLSTVLSAKQYLGSARRTILARRPSLRFKLPRPSPVHSLYLWKTDKISHVLFLARLIRYFDFTVFLTLSLGLPWCDVCMLSGRLFPNDQRCGPPNGLQKTRPHPLEVLPSAPGQRGEDEWFDWQ